MGSFTKYLIPKILMFGLYIIQCSAPNYLSLIYQDKIGLSNEMIGVLAAIPPLLCIFAGPALSFLADMTGKPKVVLTVCLVATTCTLWLFEGLSLTMGSACGVAVLYAITSAPIGSMMDVIVLNMLGEESALYGQQRVWGSVSCGITSAVGGVLVGATSIQSIFYYHSISVAAFLVLLMGVSKPWARKRRPSIKKNESSNEGGKPKIKKTAVADPDRTIEDLELRRAEDEEPPHAIVNKSRRQSLAEAARRGSRRVSMAHSLGIITDVPATDPQGGVSFGWLAAPDVLAFFFSNTIIGAVFSVVGSFLWIFLTNELNANPTVRGLTGTFQVVLQLPFFFFAKQVMQFLGVRKSIIFAHIVTIIRFLAYPMLTKATANADLAIELLHGLAYAMNWTASVAFAAQVAPRGMECMAQGILGAFYGGLGSGVGVLVAGFAYNAFGSHVLFFGCAGLTGLSLLVYVIVPVRALKTDKDPVPANERVLDRQGSRGLMEMEEGGVGTGVRPAPAQRQPSAVAVALSGMGRSSGVLAG